MQKLNFSKQYLDAYLKDSYEIFWQTYSWGRKISFRILDFLTQECLYLPVLGRGKDPHSLGERNGQILKEGGSQEEVTATSERVRKEQFFSSGPAWPKPGEESWGKAQ